MADLQVSQVVEGQLYTKTHVTLEPCGIEISDKIEIETGVMRLDWVREGRLGNGVGGGAKEILRKRKNSDGGSG